MNSANDERTQKFDAREIHCVAFDFVGTLVYASPPVAEVYGTVARRYGSRLNDLEIRQRFSEAYRRAEADDGHIGGGLQTDEARERRRWEKIVSSVLDDVSDPQECFAELFDWFGRPDAWALYPDVRAALAEIAASGYRLAIASNFDARLHTVCDGHPELCAVPLRVVSSLVGSRKPSAEFYRALTQAASCRPEQVLMIGDDDHNDVQGARNAGLQALRLDRRGDAGRPGGLRSLADLRRLLRKP